MKRHVLSARCFILILLLILIFIGSCKDDEETIKYKGVTVLSSEKKIQSNDIYIVYGFSFEKGKSVPYTLTGGSPPDIIVSNLTDVKNKITGAVLNSPDNIEAFYLNLTGTSYTEAKEWYDNYSEVTATDFKAISDSVELYQVWTVQTTAGKFAKLLIQKIDIIEALPPTPDDYIEITVDYEYQPDGSRIFRTNRSGT
jgi:hypothetical protein